MKDGLYKHLNFADLIVRVKSGCIVELVEEPPMYGKITPWSVVRLWWIQMVEDNRPIGDEEKMYFMYVKEN